jgi:DNA uptake protein ComE-like DNA-binding protein
MDERQNINDLSEKELIALPTVGESLGPRIHYYIRENGRIKDIGTLKRVFGISDKRMEKLREFVRGDEVDGSETGEDCGP